MDKAEIKRISDSLNDVYEAICEGDSQITMRRQLNELFKVIERLMDATFKDDQRLKPLRSAYKAVNLMNRNYTNRSRHLTHREMSDKNITVNLKRRTVLWTKLSNV